MNIWLIAATVLLLGLIPCGLVCFKGAPMQRLVALEMAGSLDVMVLLLLAQGFDQPPFYDLALVLALLSFSGGLVFVRFLERWV
ncbi:MAG: monovalent cation/H+ antiporter complex subunit F [Actinomycetota bacterium]|nr:monovalent cation/H+ antiporter complex subunit F [Actinomycetota bacterium]